MSEGSLVVLAVLMGLITYALRVAPFVLPFSRLPDPVARWVRLLAPASMAAAAAVALADPAIDPMIGPLGVPTSWLASAVTIVIVARRRDLALGIAGALMAGLLAGTLASP